MQGRHVVDILKALTHGLQNKGEVILLQRRIQEPRGPQTLLPERNPPAGLHPGHVERAGSALAEAGLEERRADQMPSNLALHLIGGETEYSPILQEGISARNLHDDAILPRPHGPVVTALTGEPGGNGQGPRLVDPATVRRMEDQPQVALFVGATLDHQVPVVGHLAGGGLLLGQKGRQIVDRRTVQAVLKQARGDGLGEARPTGGSLDCRHQASGQLPGEPAQATAEGGVAASALAVPEGQPGGASRGGYHYHTVAGDLLDPPRGGAQGNYVPLPGLVNHLLVQLPHSAGLAAGGLGGHDHAVGATVGNGASGGYCQALRAGASCQRACLLVPDQNGAEGGEVLGGVGTAEHAQHRPVDLLVQVGEGRSPSDRGQPILLLKRSHGSCSHRLLSQNIQGTVGHDGGFDVALDHAFHAGSALQDLLAGQGKKPGLRYPSHLVVGPAHALQPRSGRHRGVDLDDQIDRAHVDAQLQAGGGYHAPQSAGLEVVLHLAATFLGHRTMVGHGNRLVNRLAGCSLGGRPGGRTVVGGLPGLRSPARGLDCFTG